MFSRFMTTHWSHSLTSVLYFLIFTVAHQSAATVFEIFPTGMTDSCNEEFENIANALQPGDELILHDGIYAQGCSRKFTINGSAEQPIVIRAADGASPLVTRPEQSGATSNNLELEGSYFTIRGLRFQFGSVGVRFFSSHHITFEDNEIFDTLNNGLSMNSGNTDSHVIRNNQIHHTGVSTGDTEGEGMYLGTHTGTSIATNHLIENNHIHHLRSTNGGGNDGIEIKFGSGGNIIRGNLIHDTNIGVSFPCIFAYGHGPAPNIIENNIVYNCGEAILVSADAIVRNNVILNSSISGIHLNRQNPAPNIQNVSIVNNTVFGSHPVCANLKIGSAPNIVIANNAFYCEGSTAVSGNGFANASVFNNYVSGSMSGTSIDNSAFYAGGNANNVFVDTAADNFRLKTGSPLIDAGLNSVTDAGNTDHAGNARFSGASIDVGAFEYDSQINVDPPTLNLTAPVSVDSGGNVIISWTSTDTDSCVASGAWSGNRNSDGNETVGPLTIDSTFTLTCSGAGGSVVENVTVQVLYAAAQPTLTLTAPASVNFGASATLSWSTTGADSCVASDAWSGNKLANGSELVGPLNFTSTFNLTCSGAGGSVADRVTVQVAAAPVPPTLNLTAPATVEFGNNATLSWTSADASTCSASGDWSGGKAINGSETLGPLDADSTFTLTCNGAGGSISETVVVQITLPADDSDSDGLLDTWEIQHFGDLGQSGSGDPDNDTVINTIEFSDQTDPQNPDSDSDDLTDGEEIIHGTDPLKADTDDDGHSDSVEVQAGSDPNNFNSQPPIETITVPTDNGGSGALGPWCLLFLLLWRRQLTKKPAST